MSCHSPILPPPTLAITSLPPTLQICLFWTFDSLENILPFCSHPALFFFHKLPPLLVHGVDFASMFLGLVLGASLQVPEPMTRLLNKT